MEANYLRGIKRNPKNVSDMPMLLPFSFTPIFTNLNTNVSFFYPQQWETFHQRITIYQRNASSPKPTNIHLLLSLILPVTHIKTHKSPFTHLFTYAVTHKSKPMNIHLPIRSHMLDLFITHHIIKYHRIPTNHHLLYC
jgi:hypothetical protein